jgi:16S rRNA (guanine966-N2)-methyltransferase
MTGRQRNQRKKPGTVRIIAGIWRGRRLPVPDLEGLRPSGDRSRETLFNWLQPYLHQARCVDLFAGTGVLGLEAVSRGAAGAILVEKSPSAVVAIKESVKQLKARQVTVVAADAFRWLENQPPQSADIVFVDPPFDQAVTQRALQALDAADLVRPGGIVYLESARSEQTPVAAQTWQCVKEIIVGEVRMQLFQK